MLEGRQLLSAVPLGAAPYDTAEFLLGSVTVTPVLLESNGAIDADTEDWTTAEIDQVLANIAEGMQWWVDSLAGMNSVHSLEFTIDDAFATTPVETPYEPISRRSDSYTQYVGRFLADQGYDGTSLTLEEAMREFNHSQRLQHDTNWAFTIFVVDSSNDPDGQFDHLGTFRQAFAFAGGLFMVVPSGRPASTYAHETGHIFWARDEYPGSGSYDDERGYYNTQNTNAVDDAPDGFVQEPSIMTSGYLLQQAYDNNISAASTFAQVGWQDSDADGIFDVLDVPLSLDVSALYSPASNLLQLRGTASAVALPNQNSSGLANDITLNEVSRLEYRLDGGAWQTLASPNQQSAVIDLSYSITDPFSNLEIQAIDDLSGVTSPIIQVPVDRPTAGYAATIDGFAFEDEDQDGQWDEGEYLVPNIVAQVQNVDGIFLGRVEPDDDSGTVYSGNVGGLTLEAIGNTTDGRVAAFPGSAATGSVTFQAGSIFGGFSEDWTAIKQELEVVFDQATSDVSIMAIGREADSIGRLEAYDIDGNLIQKSSSASLAIGETAQLHVHDAQGRIASVRVFGAAGTDVGLDDLRYGPSVSTTSSTFGAFRFDNLPSGQFNLLLESTSSQFVVDTSEVTVDVVAGTTTVLAVPVTRVSSPWTNPIDPLDVNNNGEIQPLDALVVINELNRTSSRGLTDDDLAPPYLDVNGDQMVTPIDALRVINYLNRGDGAGEGESGGPLDFGPPGPSGGQSGFAYGGQLEGEAWQDDELDDHNSNACKPASPVTSTPASSSEPEALNTNLVGPLQDVVPTDPLHASMVDEIFRDLEEL